MAGASHLNMIPATDGQEREVYADHQRSDQAVECSGSGFRTWRVQEETLGEIRIRRRRGRRRRRRKRGFPVVLTAALS